MDHKYIYPKKKFIKSDIERVQIFFTNGDYLSVHASEIADIELKLYDRLVWRKIGVCPVAERGFIKLKIESVGDSSVFLYNLSEYERDRKSYIQNRCVEGGIAYVNIFNHDNWHDTIFGNISAEMNGKFLILKFSDSAGYGSSESENNVIYLNDVEKSQIQSITLDFENCDSFDVYPDEIIDIGLQLGDTLGWGSGDLLRYVKSGFIKLKFNKKRKTREVNLDFKSFATIKKLQKRLCWYKHLSPHDICHLYIDYDYAGWGLSRVECIEVEDICPEEFLQTLDDEEGFFIGGYSKKLPDGTIIITFGENAEEAIEDCRFE